MKPVLEEKVRELELDNVHIFGGFNDHLRLFLGGFCQSNDLLVSAFVLLIITDGTILSIEWGQNPS